jgi:hypothetical protein
MEAGAAGPGMPNIQNPVPGGLQETLGLSFGADSAPNRRRKEAINEPAGAGCPASGLAGSQEIH